MPFFAHWMLFFKILKKKKKKTLHWSKVLNKTIWDFYLAHVHVFYKIIIFNSKVFKFQHDSSVTLNGNQSKNPNLSGEIDNNFHKNSNFLSESRGDGLSVTDEWPDGRKVSCLILGIIVEVVSCVLVNCHDYQLPC